MNPPLNNNYIHTNLPSLDDLKKSKFINILYTEQGKHQNNEKFHIRMLINKKPEYYTLYFKDYIINWILDENQIIIDALKLKQELINKNKKISDILNCVNVNKGLKKINWLRLIIDKWSIMFCFRINKGLKSKSTSSIVNTNDFDNSFYNAVEKYLKLKKELWFPKIHVDEKNKLYDHLDFYRKKYSKLKQKKLINEKKEELMNKWLINDKWVILSIEIINKHLYYTNNQWVKYSRFISDSNILELIEKFVLNNNLELNWDIHNWFKENLLYYTQSYKQKLNKESKEKTESQKNSNS